MAERTFIVFGGARLPWIYPLGAELARLARTTMVELRVSASPIPRGVAWPFEDDPADLERVSWNVPPGFSGRLSFLFTRLIRQRVAKLIHTHQEKSGAAPYVIVSDPTLGKYLSDSQQERLVYLNYDDYLAHERDGVRRADCLERRIVERADTILCSSRHQSLSFKREFANQADSVFHLPHGVHESFVNPAIERRPSVDTVCAVGGLTARYDWQLIETVVRALPNTEFTFAGEIGAANEGPRRELWGDRMQDVLRLPNVRHARGLRHRETAPLYWNSAVNWMPYASGTRFVEGSCPLKLTDGLASGRSVVSAELPECRLYPEWVSVYGDADEAVTQIAEALRTSSSAESLARERAQIQFARNNTWAKRASRLAEILARQREVPCSAARSEARPPGV